MCTVGTTGPGQLASCLMLGSQTHAGTSSADNKQRAKRYPPTIFLLFADMKKGGCVKSNTELANGHDQTIALK
jgi:hypothetical protein